MLLPQNSNAADIGNSKGATSSRADEVTIDLHVHSSHSDRPYSWFLRAAKSAECYTPPTRVYELAKQRGMNLVTICDHDDIDGARELCSRHDDAFISEEISARFPEDGCIVHAIALDISEAQHAEIQRLRSNIYELVRYLDQAGIATFLCHALSPVNRRLTPSHVKRCLLMFRNLELRNGTRDIAHAHMLGKIVAGLTPSKMSRWADQFPEAPALNLEGRYAFVGGSDDHAGLSIARAFTRFHGERSGAGVTAALRERRTLPDGDAATPEVLSHNVYGVVAGALMHNGQLAQGEALDQPGTSPAMMRTLEHFGELLGEDAHSLDLGQLAKAGHTDRAQSRMFRALESVLVRSGREACDGIAKAVRDGKLADLADAVPALLKSLLLGVPYLAGARAHAHDRKAAQKFGSELGAGDEPARRAPRVAVLSDSLDEINGVALGLRRLSAAARSAGRDLRLVGFGDVEHVAVDADGIVRIPTLYKGTWPAYPSLPLGIPHVPSLLHYFLKEGIELVQCSTPGPVGLAGLIAARLAGLPVIGQYHTDVPVYVERLTGDPVVGAMASRYVGWFYGQLDQVLAPSAAVASRLDQLGVPPARVRNVPRGIDLGLFTPRQRSQRALASVGIKEGPVVLYVGRLSKEKNLDRLLDAFSTLIADREAPTEIAKARLLLVGSGPHAEALQIRARPLGERVVFAGERRGEELATLMSSCDVFAFPSETETFGNAVVEAQAAGLPVVVAQQGAARENMVEGATGLVVDAKNPAALTAALRQLLVRTELRAKMSQEAARFSRRYDMANAVLGTFEVYDDILHGDVYLRAA